MHSLLALTLSLYAIFFLTLHTIYTPTGCICTHVPSGCTDILSRVRSTRLTHLRASAHLAKGEPVMSTGNGWPHYHHHTHSYTRCCGCVRRAHRLYTPATTLRTSTSAKGVDAPRPSRTPATRTALSLHTHVHTHTVATYTAYACEHGVWRGAERVQHVG